MTILLALVIGIAFAVLMYVVGNFLVRKRESQNAKEFGLTCLAAYELGYDDVIFFNRTRAWNIDIANYRRKSFIFRLSQKYYEGQKDAIAQRAYKTDELTLSEKDRQQVNSFKNDIDEMIDSWVK